MTSPRFDDARLEAAVGALLRGGVLLAAAVIALGVVLHLLQAGGAPAPGHVFTGEPADLRSVPGILGDAFGHRPRGILQLGLLLLIATPIARVALLVVAFALERDALYVAVSCVVLAILVAGLVS